jgi:hypothetical protein
MSDLAPILRYDFTLVEHMVQASSAFAGIAAEREILLLDGGTSPAYARAIDARLEEVVKGVRRVTLQSVGHEVLCNRDFRGSPGKAVGVIGEFLS